MNAVHALRDLSAADWAVAVIEALVAFGFAAAVVVWWLAVYSHLPV